MEDENKNGCCSWHGGHRGLKKAATWAFAILAVFLLAKTVTEVQGFRYIGTDKPAQSTIYVSGKGEVFAIPDIATFSFSVTKESMKVSEAQKQAADESNAIIDFLKENGVAEKDIKTDGYNIYPRYEYPKVVSGVYYPNGQRTLVAYVVSESFTVKARKIDEAGKLISGVGSLGATEVSGLTLSVDKEDDFKKEARDLAIEDAQKQAKSLARALGVKLVRVVNFSENNVYPIYYSKGAALGMGGDMAAPAPQLPAGETKIVSNVSITYEIR